MPRSLVALVAVTALIGATLTLASLVAGAGRALTGNPHAAAAVPGPGQVHGDSATQGEDDLAYMGEGRHEGGGGHMGHHGVQVSSEQEFLVEMIPHHEEAITQAGHLLERTGRAEMRQFAQEIIDTQTAEVRTMLAWLDEHYPNDTTQARYQPMMRDLSGLAGDELDRTFLEDMIPHHMTAVVMSQYFVSGGLVENADVVPFAEQIRDTQFQEVLMMKQWLPEWFGPDAAYRHQMGTMRHSSP